MVIKVKPAPLHWNYFLAIEADIERLARYVDFTEDNFKTYSIEMAHLLLAIASEVDVVAKLLCNKVSLRSKADNIEKYRTVLKPMYPKIEQMHIHIPRFGIELNPWDNWKSDKTPNWWSDYNNVKHGRDKYFSQANLENTLNAVGGLFVLLLYYYKELAEVGELIPEPKLFVVHEKFISNYEALGGITRTVYKL